MASQTGTTRSLSRDSWVHRALEILRDEGIQGVRVERLARDLGVTKGSFYWHFKDLEDLRRSILEFWTKKYNDAITENAEFLAAAPEKGLLAAFTKVRDDELDRYELAMRGWADQDPEADRTVRAAYEKRNKFVRSFFNRLGFRGMDVEIRTRAILCYLSWEPNMYADESESQRITRLKRLLELLTRA